MIHHLHIKIVDEIFLCKNKAIKPKENIEFKQNLVFQIFPNFKCFTTFLTA
jgi:hypothetical protein